MIVNGYSEIGRFRRFRLSVAFSVSDKMCGKRFRRFRSPTGWGHDLDLSGRVDYDGVVRFATPSAGGSELDVSAVTVSRDARRSSGFRQDLTPRTPSAADDPFPFAPSGDPFNMEQSK